MSCRRRFSFEMQRLSGFFQPRARFRAACAFCCIAALLFAGCSGLDRAPSRGPAPAQIYEADKEAAWKALVQVFKPYPKKTLDAENGIIETERLRGRALFRPPQAVPGQLSGRFFYTLRAVLREKEDEPDMSRAQIRKTVSRQKDFFSEPEVLPSDLFEEEALLYRIDRELQIKHLVDKIYKKEEEKD